MQNTTSPEYIAEKMSVNNNEEEQGKLAPFSSETNEQWKAAGEKVSTFLSDLPDYLTEFFGEYRRPIVVVGAVIAALIATKMLFAVLGAVNDIPLLSPLFELVGLSYSVWFVYRYVLKESTRKELGEGLDSLKEQILGSKK